MYCMRILLYGSAASQALARNILQNLDAVKREESVNNGAEIRLFLSCPLNETSLIPLLYPSGLHGFRLVDKQ